MIAQLFQLFLFAATMWAQKTFFDDIVFVENNPAAVENDVETPEEMPIEGEYVLPASGGHPGEMDLRDFLWFRRELTSSAQQDEDDQSHWLDASLVMILRLGEHTTLLDFITDKEIALHASDEWAVASADDFVFAL